MVAILLALLLLGPTAATACPIPFRTIGPVRAGHGDVRRPIMRSTSRAAWQLDASWTATSPELNQFVRTVDGRRHEFVTFARQQALSIDAAAPADNGWLYGDDDDPATPPCRLAGQGEWQAPVIRLREGPREVRVVAAARRTVGDRAGCRLGAGQDALTLGCPTLTRSIRLLKRPLGSRTLVFETFD